jgi:phosphatidylinositol 4-kinase
MAVVGKNLQKPPDENDPVPEIAALREKMHSALAAVRDKRNPFTVQDLKRLLFRCAASLIAVTKVWPTAQSVRSLTGMTV